MSACWLKEDVASALDTELDNKSYSALTRGSIIVDLPVVIFAKHHHNHVCNSDVALAMAGNFGARCVLARAVSHKSVFI